MPRFSFKDDIEEDSPSSSDVERENEPPHPLGFASPRGGDAGTPRRKGTSRYALDFDDDTDDWLERKAFQSGLKIHPPISSYIHTNNNSTPMKVLLRDAHLSASARKDYNDEDQEEDDYDDHDGLGGLMDALQAITMSKPTSNISAIIPRPPPTDLSYYRIGAKEDQIRVAVAKQKEKFDQQNNEFERKVKEIIEKEQKEAERVMAERQQQEREHQEQVEREAQEREAERQRKEDAEEDKKRQDKLEATAKAEQDAKKKAEDDAKAQVEAEAARKKKEESNYIEKAQILVGQLKKLRKSVEPFDQSKPMGKRRLAMKKIVNGRVNTLAEDVNKILEVARDVNAAIATARQDDGAAKTELAAGNPQVSEEMALGKRYFLDLLSSKVVVRVQAEGFNGQRGDGFPLAHMLAQVAAENKDFVPILNAHIYTVCPTAIPYLPTPSVDASEDDLMESLGMQKGSDGNYETFERFLHRTEGLISIVADIMSSKPTEHQLFGGSSGGILWLKRFLEQLPSPPHSPLPLITAPVLDAFLTGAGHMLANTSGEEFKKLLSEVETDVMPRLDDGTIGAPSAIRLRKTMKEGFEGFRNNLPSRALAELYNGGEHSSGGHGSLQSNPFGTSSSNQGAAPSPFGISSGSSAPTPSIFGGSSGQSALAPSPFGTSSGQPAPAPPFGMTSGTGAPTPSPIGTSSQPAQAPSPFGTSLGQSAPAPSPFGTSTGQPAPVPSPFGTSSGQPAPAPSPFGNAAPAPSPFGSTAQPSAGSAFQMQAAPMASPFGNSGPLNSPFGGNSSNNAMNASSAPSPFGAAPAPSGSVFGQTPAPAATFGSTMGGFGQQTSTFGGAPAPAFGSSAGGPFGAPAPANASPFGAPAPGSFGGSTPFSVAGTNNPSPFGAPTQGPFGGSGNQFSSAGPTNPSPFGAPASTPFSSSTPFAPPASSNASPFGAPSPSPFGGGGVAPSPSPFGGFAAAPAPTPFSGGNNGGGIGGQSNDRPACKFFARGACKNGNNCRFSHSVQPSNTSFSNPFGGPRR